MKFTNLIFAIVLILTAMIGSKSFAAGGSLNQLSHATLKAVAGVTADGLTAAVDLQQYTGPICFIVNVEGTGGADTIDLAIHSSATSAGTYAVVTGASFTQVGTAASQQMLCVNKDEFNRFVKLNMDVTGTVDLEVAASIVGFKKYRP